MEQARHVEGGEQTSIEGKQLAMAGGEQTLVGRSDSNGHRLDDASPQAMPDVCPAIPDDESAPTRPGERPDYSGQVLANVYTDPIRHTVSLLLDDRTANCLIYAARVLAAEYEAHAREVRLVSATLPPVSYGAVNRLRIAWRHERIAERLRLLERNYQTEVSGWSPQPAPDAI
jgi:hypothetical protein